VYIEATVTNFIACNKLVCGILSTDVKLGERELIVARNSSRGCSTVITILNIETASYARDRSSYTPADLCDCVAAVADNYN